MGYYSEVAITIMKSDFVNMVDKAKVECEKALELIMGAKILLKNKFVTMYIGAIIWAGEAADFLALSLEEIPHNFKRVGWDYDDIEHKYQWGDEDNYAIQFCVQFHSKLVIDNAGDEVDISSVLYS